MKGTNQSQDTLFIRIFEKYEELKEAHKRDQIERLGDYVPMPQRNFNQVRSQWYSSILPATTKYAAICGPPPPSGVQCKKTYHAQMCALYKQRVALENDRREAAGKKKSNLPATFERFLAGYEILIVNPRWRSHFIDGEGHTKGKVKEARSRPSPGRDATKLGKKVRVAAEKIQQAMGQDKTTQEKESTKEKKDREQWRSDMMAVLKKSIDIQVMAFASAETKERYFESLATTALIEAETAQKEAEFKKI